MLVASKIMSIGIIVLSITIGLAFFYIMSDVPKEQKKRHIGELTLQLIHFILFIWLGKVILHFSVFIKDPVAVLAHPSNAEAFYLAVLFSGIVLVYKSVQGQMNELSFVESFLHVFLTASFLYEFMQVVWNDSTHSLGYLVLITVLLILFLLVRGRLATRKLMIMMVSGWSLGIVILSFIQPFVTVFGYIMAPWFIGVFFITSLSFIIFIQRKRD